MPDANAVARGLSNMTGLPQKAIVHDIVDSGDYGLHQSNQLSVDKLFRFLTQPRMIEFYRSMADEQVQAMILASQILAVISPVTETHVRLIEVMFKEINLVGMDQVDALSPASIQTYNEFKKAVSVYPFKKQAKIIVKTLIRQLAGFDRDMDNANEVEREVLGLVGQLYTEMVKNVLEAIQASVLPYGYRVLGKPKIVPFVAIAEAIDATFMAGQTSPEMAIAMLGKQAQSLGVSQANVLVAAGMLEFWRTNMLPGREVDFLKGYYSPESGIEYRSTGQQDIGTGQILSRGVIRAGNLTVDLWEAPVPKVNSNDSGVDRMQAIRSVMGQFFTFPQNSEGLLISGKDAERANNTVDVFTIDGNSGKNVVYHYIQALKLTGTFNAAGDGPSDSLQKTINVMNGNSVLKKNWDKATSGQSSGSFSEGDKLTGKNYRSAPALVRYNQADGQFEFAKRLGDTNELTDSKLLQIANALVSNAELTGKGSTVHDDIETVTEFLRDSVETEVTGDFLSALVIANQVVSQTGPWVLNDYGSLNLPKQTAPTSSGLPPLFHNVAGLRTLARERNAPNSIWSGAGQRAYLVLQALRSIADGLSAISDQQRDDMLQHILELVYVMEYKKAYPAGVFLRGSSVGPAVGDDDADGYQTVSSVLEAANPTTYGEAVTALGNLNYNAPEVVLLRYINDGPRRLAFVSALAEIADPSIQSSGRKKKALDTITRLNRAVVENFTEEAGATKDSNRQTIISFVNGPKVDDAFLTLYSEDALAPTQTGNYPVPDPPVNDNVYTNAQIVAFNAAMTAARNGNDPAVVPGYAGIPPELVAIVTQASADANRGDPIVADGSIGNAYILAPLVSTSLLETYANAAGPNALAIPAYEGVTDMSIDSPIRGAIFKHNVAFAGQHFRSYFALNSSSLGQRNDAMDIDAAYDMLVSGQALGANGILNDDTSMVESRLELVVNSSATTAARLMASVIVGLPNTLAIHTRLSKVGARLLNVALLRPFETNLMSLISISALNGFATMVCPTEFTSEHHSQVSTMILTMAKEIGTNVIDERRVTGICGFTSHRAIGGYNQFFVTAGDLDRDLMERPSVIAIAFPDAVEYALGDYLHLFNNLPIRYGGDLRIDSKCKHPAALHLEQRFPELLSLVTQAEESATDIHTTVQIAPILSRGLTRHFNPKSGRYETIRSGVSRKASIVLNSPGAEDLYNGGIRTNVSNNSDFATTRMGFR